MPLPGDAKLTRAGLGLGGVRPRRPASCRASPRRSTMTSGALASRTIGARSFCGSYGSLAYSVGLIARLLVCPSTMRVAVGRRLGDGVDAEVAAGAGLVVDDEGPAGRRGDLLARLAGNDVGAAARAGTARRGGSAWRATLGRRRRCRGWRRRAASSEAARGLHRCLRLSCRLTPRCGCSCVLSGFSIGVGTPTVQSIVSCDPSMGLLHMDLRDLRYFETIAELQHLGRASAQAAPHAAGPDELRAAARGGLRRRPVREGRSRHPARRRRARCCSSGRSACASMSRTRSARSPASARARRACPHRHRADRGAVRAARRRAAAAARGAGGDPAHGGRPRRHARAAAARRARST